VMEPSALTFGFTEATSKRGVESCPMIAFVLAITTIAVTMAHPRREAPSVTRPMINLGNP
jgi:hypothetical protein